MNKNYLLFGIILLGSLLIINSSYTPPALNQINVTLCTGYTPPALNQINVTLGETDDECSSNCWSYDSTTKVLYVPNNCTYYIPSGTTGYFG